MTSGLHLSHLGSTRNPTTIRPLHLINGVAVEIPVRTAFKMADDPNIRQVWYLHPDLADLYVNTIAALDYNVQTLPLPNLANMSISPQSRFWRRPPSGDTPMNAATSAPVKAGLVLIVAIGNTGVGGDKANGWLNPWCYPEWVICVGAYDAVKREMAPFSSRGDPNDKESWPDVVAHGVDVIGPYPTHLVKSPERRKRDESNASFRRVVPQDKWHIYTLESGTSQAAANVTGAAAQVLHFLKALIASGSESKTGQPIFSLTASPERITQYDRIAERLTGTARKQTDGSVVYEYPLDLPWKMVKQLIVDTAIPLTDKPVHVVGAGVVDRKYINQQFGRFGIAKPEIVPAKVLRE